MDTYKDKLRNKTIAMNEVVAEELLNQHGIKRIIKDASEAGKFSAGTVFESSYLNKHGVSFLFKIRDSLKVLGFIEEHNFTFSPKYRDNVNGFSIRTPMLDNKREFLAKNLKSVKLSIDWEV